MNAKIFVGTLCLLPCALGAAVTTAVDHPAAARAVQLLEGKTGDAAVRLEVAPALASTLADGYEVRRAPDGTLVVAGARPRALLYAAYEPQRWLGAGDAPVRRVPHFRQRLLNFTGKGHSVADWVAATGANSVHLARNAAGRLVQACRDADVDVYAFLYGCDASKWNRGRFAAFIAAHPEAKGVDPGRSWEKGVLCPSSPATWAFFAQTITELAESGDFDGVVVTFWDDYGLNCCCEKCRTGGLNSFGARNAVLVNCFEQALKAIGKRLVVRTWASGAPHFLGDEWVHAPGYAGREDALATWARAFEASDRATVFVTKVYNADCQPDPPFSNLLGAAAAAGRTELAEWQITGQTVGLNYLPYSNVGHTARTMKRAAALVGRDNGVCLYAGGYKRGDYEALDDDVNSINIHAWRQLAWDPDDDVAAIWREWAEPRYGTDAPAAVAALQACERAAVVAFSPLGLGAPTESKAAKTVQRREDLFRYTNRQYLPEGRAALMPTEANIQAVVDEKNAAIAALEAARPAAAEGPAAELARRMDLLIAHLKTYRAVDGAMWRFRRLRFLKDMGVSDARLMREIEADFDFLRHNPYPLSEELGSPAPLMRDIHSNALVCVERILGPDWRASAPPAQ